MSDETRDAHATPDVQRLSQRAVLLGASNVALGLSTAVEVVRRSLAEPVDVMIAAGFGRSYGIESNVLGRVLPGIVDCRLFEDLKARSPATTLTLLTDVGNDLLYDVPVDRIIEWLDRCLNRLKEQTDRLILTQIPISSLSSLGSTKYRIMRTVLFPGCRIGLKTMLRRAERLSERLTDLSRNYDAHLVVPRADWYGWDPIHVKSRLRMRVWEKFFSADSSHVSSVDEARRSMRRMPHLHRLRPSYRRVFGFVQRRAQPCGRLRDGTAISLY